MLQLVSEQARAESIEVGESAPRNGNAGRVDAGSKCERQNGRKKVRSEIYESELGKDEMGKESRKQGEKRGLEDVWKRGKL